MTVLDRGSCGRGHRFPQAFRRPARLVLRNDFRRASSRRTRSTDARKRARHNEPTTRSRRADAGDATTQAAGGRTSCRAARRISRRARDRDPVRPGARCRFCTEGAGEEDGNQEVGNEENAGQSGRGFRSRAGRSPYATQAGRQEGRGRRACSRVRCRAAGDPGPGATGEGSHRITAGRDPSGGATRGGPGRAATGGDSRRRAAGRDPRGGGTR
jgi:hypothetical protein